MARAHRKKSNKNSSNSILNDLGTAPEMAALGAILRPFEMNDPQFNRKPFTKTGEQINENQPSKCYQNTAEKNLLLEKLLKKCH